MTRKNATKSFGSSLRNEHKRRIEAQQRKHETEVYVPCEATSNARSVLEQSSLDDLLQTVEIRKLEWNEAYGAAEVLEDSGDGPVLLDLNAPLAEAEEAAAKSRELVSIPRRPKWHEGMSIEELGTLESEAFIEWRRGLKQLEKDGGLVMTPYERNLDFWRQLWRCMERSDLLVQVLDARDPDFYFCQDLYRYVSELDGSKRLMLLVNKADYLSREQRQRWADHFEAKGVDAIFFSALNELQKQEKSDGPRPSETQDEKDAVESGEAQDSVCPSRQGEAEPSSDASNSANAGQTSRVDLDPVDIPVPDSSDDEADGEANVVAAVSEGDESEDEAAGPRGVRLENVDEALADVAGLLDAIRARLPKYTDRKADVRRGKYGGADETHEAQKEGVVGFVGYPNVGKSTVINALVGAKKVGMSRTPGKTKHIQTLQLPEWGFTLCDAPGLVFPSVVATRSHLVINNTVPLDDLRECFSPIRLIVEKIGYAEVLQRYRCASYVKDAAARSGDHVLDEAHSFLAALSVSRNHFLRVGVPDENWAARKVLRDYCTGKLLHCESPPGSVDRAASATGDAAEPAQDTKAGPEEGEEDGDDFDLSSVMMDNASTMGLGKVTKRKERHIQKQLSKGVTTQFAFSKTDSGYGVGANVRAKAIG